MLRIILVTYEANTEHNVLGYLMAREKWDDEVFTVYVENENLVGLHPAPKDVFLTPFA